MKLTQIVIEQGCFDSEDDYDVIRSNIDFLNTLSGEYVTFEEVSEEALKSYYVDFYLAQINNGGFSQFVFNARANLPKVLKAVTEGLSDMEATKNLKLFNQSAAIIRHLSEERLEKYLDSQYWGDNEERDVLNAFDYEFYGLQEHESLLNLNARWIRSHPQLLVLDAQAIEHKVEEITQSLPDLEARIQASLEAEPRYIKIIRALVAHAGQEFESAHASSPCQYEGEEIWAEHFKTNLGHHYMIEHKGKALLFNGASNALVDEIEIEKKFRKEN